jgi:hypothetical protein
MRLTRWRENILHPRTRKPVSLMRGYQHHVDSHGIRTVQSASSGDRLRSAAACTCQRSLPTLYSMLLLE